MAIGKITVITGPMFCGKTTYLMNEFDKAKKVGIPIIFKPSEDDRYDAVNIVTHNNDSKIAIVCRSSNKIYEYLSVNRVITDIFIDEVQFFDDDIVEVVDWARNEGFNVCVAGLNQDYLGKPFYFRDRKKHIGELLCLADDIKHLKSRCQICGEPASKTSLKPNDAVGARFEDSQILVGSSDLYEARCFRHHKKERF